MRSKIEFRVLRRQILHLFFCGDAIGFRRCGVNLRGQYPALGQHDHARRQNFGETPRQHHLMRDGSGAVAHHADLQRCQ